MDVAVYSPQFQNSATANLNCSLHSRFVIIIQKIPVLHKLQLFAQESHIVYRINRSSEVKLHCSEAAIYPAHL